MITVIFKRNSIFFELKKLFDSEGVDFKRKNNFVEFKKSTNKEGIVLIHIESEKMARTVSIEGKGCLKNMEIICLLDKDYKSFEKRNDYKIIYQPVVFNELLKIIENSIKNLMSNKKNSFQIMNLTYFPSASELFNNNSSITIRLTDLENKLVKFLIKKKNGALKSEILKNVWMHKKELETHTLESLIYRLRKKIEEDPNNPRILIQKKRKYILSN